MQLNNISIQWGTRTVLASANMRQVYDLAVKNGCTLSWSQWSGGPMNNGNAASATPAYGTANAQYGTTGSIVALDCLDLGLSDLDAPGKVQNLMFQVTSTWTNICSVSLNPTLYIVTVSQGLFSLHGGQASCLIGVLSPDDILRSHSQTAVEMISYAEVRRINGGNFLSDIKLNLEHLLKKHKHHGHAGGAEGGIHSHVAHVHEHKRAGAATGGAPVRRRTLKRRMAR